MKLTLPKGTTGFTDNAGKWICTGSQMCRRNRIPSNPDEVAMSDIERCAKEEAEINT